MKEIFINFLVRIQKVFLLKFFCFTVFFTRKALPSFHTFSMVDGPSSYLQSNRESSKRLGKKVKEELGSLGRTLIENLESIENETEFNAGHAFVRRGFTFFLTSYA